MNTQPHGGNGMDQEFEQRLDDLAGEKSKKKMKPARTTMDQYVDIRDFFVKHDVLTNSEGIPLTVDREKRATVLWQYIPGFNDKVVAGSLKGILPVHVAFVRRKMGLKLIWQPNSPERQERGDSKLAGRVERLEQEVIGLRAKVEKLWSELGGD